jgi:hypothetical protein
VSGFRSFDFVVVVVAAAAAVVVVAAGRLSPLSLPDWVFQVCCQEKIEH